MECKFDLRHWWEQLSDDCRADLLDGAWSGLDGLAVDRIIQTSPAWASRLFVQGYGGSWHVTAEVKEFLSELREDVLV